jgi:plasmid stabilization system protein ParE
MNRYAFHPEAYGDLADHWEYIAEHRSIDAADRLIADVFDALDTLASFPHIGHMRADLTSRPLRFHVVHDLLIAFAPDERPLWVIAVLHGRRNPRIMAAILRGREGG